MTVFSNVSFCVFELSTSFTCFSMKTLIFFSLQLFFKLFLYYAVLGLQCLQVLSLVAASGGFSRCRAQALGFP